LETLYSENPEAKKVVQSYDWPPGGRLRIDFQDKYLRHPTPEGHTRVLILRLFRDNFNTFDGVEQLRIAKIIGDLIPRLNSMGIPTFFEVAKGDGSVD